MTGQVERFVTVQPKRVKLWGELGQEIKATVRIIPKEKYPFKIIESHSRTKKNIQFDLEEEGSGYLLTIENIKKDKGRYYETVLLKTDSKIRPEIKIGVSGNITEHKPNAKK